MMNMLPIYILRKCRFRVFDFYQLRQRSSYRRTKVHNPGIQHRLKISSEEDDVLNEFDEFESDFMTVNREHSAHERELEEQKYWRQLKTVERKYFKQDKEPNFLTWEEQTQIRYLHEQDPEEWSVEKLAQSFPATESAIQRILKAAWKPANPERILKYNENVLANWKLLQEGSLHVPNDLKAHILQFASRRAISSPPPCLSVKKETSLEVQKGKSEFVDIIESYQALISSENNCQDCKISDSKQIVASHISSRSNTSVLPFGKSNTTPVTLDKFRRDIIDAIDDGHAATEKDKAILFNYGRNKHSEEKIGNFSSNELNIVSLESNKVHRNTVDVQSKSSTASETKPLPERIKIPRKYWGKGHLFRIDDSFYDEDGEFLYRVPGMKR